LDPRTRANTKKNVVNWSKCKPNSTELGGVTRNAVIGKVHRLGLSNRINPPSKETKTENNKTKNTKTGKTSTLSESKRLKKPIDKESSSSTPGINETKTADFSKTSNLRQNKAVIFNANQPLPPQPSTSEISEETLKSVRSLEKKSKKLSLMELTERTCKWPIGDPATEEFWFCGHPAEQGKPYCETHIEIAFQPVTSRRDKRAR
jgi:GcrA cell cycle regulator